VRGKCAGLGERLELRAVTRDDRASELGAAIHFVTVITSAIADADYAPTHQIRQRMGMVMDTVASKVKGLGFGNTSNHWWLANITILFAALGCEYYGDMHTVALIGCSAGALLTVYGLISETQS
jgi:hypothetical protein